MLPRTLGAALMSALLVPVGTAGQLPAASPTVLATANNYTALARGFTAIGINPAGLAMPDGPSFSLALAPVQIRSGLAPLTLGDMSSYSGELVPAATKEAWLTEISQRGQLTGSGGLDATYLALSVGNFGLQVSTVGQATASLNPDAAELLLFGNAGRTGVPRDYALAGTEVDAWLATTVGFAFGIPVLDTPTGHLALGATVKYTMGHVLVLARDAGSLVESDPIGVDLDLPSIGPGDGLEPNNGTGVGLDLGAAWQSGPWSLGASVQNVFNTFEWDLDGFSYRPGEALFNADSTSSNFEERPIAEAPAGLSAEATSQRFEPIYSVGLAYRASGHLTVTVDARRNSGSAFQIGEESRIGVGVEFRPFGGFLPLRGGVALVTNQAVQYAGGIGLGIGPLNLTSGLLIQRGVGGELTVASLGLSFGHQ